MHCKAATKVIVRRIIYAFFAEEYIHERVYISFKIPYNILRVTDTIPLFIPVHEISTMCSICWLVKTSHFIHSWGVQGFVRAPWGNIDSMLMEFFLNRSAIFSEFREFRESDKSLKHELVSIKDFLSYLCLCSAEEECWFLTQAIAGSHTVIFCIFSHRIQGNL